MNRIYVKISTEQLKSSDRGRCYLAYLLIRKASKKQAGGFSLNLFLNTVGLKHRAGGNLLKQLVERGFVIQQTASNYRITPHKGFFENKNARQDFFSVTDEQMDKFSIKSIASFRAFITELEIERYKRHQRSKAEGFTVIDYRSKQRDKIKNTIYREWNNLMACDCTAKLIGFSRSTASVYRKKQKISRYFFKPVLLGADSREVSSEGKEIRESDFKGKLIPHKGNLFFFPITERTTDWRLRRG